MKYKLVALWFLLFFLAEPLVVFAGELSGLVVVIDPGHGGKDPGASGFFSQGKTKIFITEDEYCYDVAMRLKRMIKAKGAIVELTVIDRQQTKPIANKPADVIAADKEEIFADGTQVVAGKTGLRKRVAHANQIRNKYGKNNQVVFISIHFDVLANSNIEGIRVIDSKSGSQPGALLETEIAAGKRATNGQEAHVRNGDKTYG